MSYNKKDMVQETWCVFSKAKATALSLKCLKPFDGNPEEEQLKGFDDLIAELPDDEKPDWLKSKPVQTTKQKSKLINVSDSEDSTLSSDTDSDEDEIPDIVEIEIKIKSKSFIIKGSNVYDKNTGELYGTYTNGKVKRKQQTDIVV
jgi:hypothetical protein